jgi:hypothetical protein
MEYVLYAIPAIAFTVTLCVIISTPGTSRDELDAAALLQDLERRRRDGAV